MDKLLSVSLAKAFQTGSSLREVGYSGRFAPSPTGPLHLGNFRTALISWLKARSSSGKWILRIDDLDTPRIFPGSIEKIKEDLLWLGLSWDDPIVFQSNRKDLYESAIKFLIEKGNIYACKCTRKTLAAISKSVAGLNIYPGRCRDLGLPLDSSNSIPNSLRLKVDKYYLQSSGDVIVRRSDGIIAYHLATVIDDLSLGITEVVRGSDLASSLPSQLAIKDDLHYEKIIYSHLPVMLNSDGTKLSKRYGGITLDYFKEKGMKSSKVIGLLASTLNLVPKYSELSCDELLSDIKQRSYQLDNLCESQFIS
ncbi:MULTISPECIES: tRNA glutamyl-Q(34) synthetase GluQRS [Prochlorococcus]|uniref:tRNA glutamyl-Q(34) synthetase GluQRS n=1 Tax=Prochlorococcus TaxID=1218 RepID=UPI0005339C96|nr:MULTISPECIES: tRNA glutamyl-Q(34) synthetase GluQRS [Prochlorococcus]KGG11957.1 glutamyl-Q-tRNA synthetase [Prochlorococcus sp. MIT 0601]